MPYHHAYWSKSDLKNISMTQIHKTIAIQRKIEILHWSNGLKPNIFFNYVWINFLDFFGFEVVSEFVNMW